MIEKNLSIAHLRELCPVEDCEKKYYKELDFVDLYENPNVVKKKSIPFNQVNPKAYCVGFFRNGHLIRLDDHNGCIPEETYVLLKDGLAREAYTLKMKDPPLLNHSYWYEYDAERRMLRNSWKKHLDYHNRRHDGLTVLLDYAYDTEGLRFIYKTIVGTTFSDKFVLYDREKEQFMKQFTVSKSALIEHAARKNDGLVEFDNQSGYRTKKCPHCGGELSYILTLNLQDRKSIHQTASLNKFPVLFCFDCLSDQQYTLEELSIPVRDTPFVRNAAYRFSGTLDEEKMTEAFLTVGGMPDWVQCDEHPNCPVCGKPMVYVMKINSREEYSNGRDPLMFGDCGSLYVFSCCNHVTVIMQCT